MIIKFVQAVSLFLISIVLIIINSFGLLIATLLKGIEYLSDITEELGDELEKQLRKDKNVQ